MNADAILLSGLVGGTYLILTKVRPRLLARDKREWDAVAEFKRTRNVDKFVAYLTANPPTFATRRAYETRRSRSGRISLCEDIYGAEIKIDGGKMIDCYSESYNISHADGQRIHDAILGITPRKPRENLGAALMGLMLVTHADRFATALEIPSNNQRSEKEVRGIVDQIPTLPSQLED